MKDIKLLDCTLRDGGFVNDWNFGEDCIVNIFERLDLAGIDIIEVGYLRDYVKPDINKTEFPHTKYIDSIVPKKTQNNPMIVAIIDYGDCSLDCIDNCDNTVLNGIRVTFKKKELNQAIEFCSAIKNKGYKVFLQPVSIMDYTSQDILNLVKAANALNPYAVCIVDTYGFMHKRDLIKYFFLMDSNLSPNILLGYHSHNNFQLAYSNAIELLEQQTGRDMFIDTSIFGMGKGAGNANTELMALYLNENMDGRYNIDQLLEVIDTYIGKLREQKFWGYSLQYYLAAANDCHHKYISFLLDKKTLSIQSINEIISKIDKDKKTIFDNEYIIKLYNDYQKNSIDDVKTYNSFDKRIRDRKILILAPGSTLRTQREKIQEFIDDTKPCIIAVNHVPENFPIDYIFVSNAKRYSQIALKLKRYNTDVKIIATSNINPTTLSVDYRLNYSDLLQKETEISDNSTLMLISALINLKFETISIAGFDGYIENDENYFDSNLEFSGNIGKKNELIKNAVSKLSKSIKIDFITKSIYR